MNEITKSITYLKEYKQLKQAVDEGKSPVLAVGLSAIHKAHLAAALGLDTGRPVLVLTDDDNAANRFAADLRGFAERDIVQLPSRELVMADVVGVSRLEDMQGKYVRVAIKGWGSTIKIIGNIINDRWFDYKTFFTDKKEESK